MEIKDKPNPFQNRKLKKSPPNFDTMPIGPFTISRGPQNILVKMVSPQAENDDPFRGFDSETNEEIELDNEERIRAYRLFNQKPPTKLLNSK